MMKQKWYLLIICLVYCVTVWAQDDNPLWSIDNLSLSLQGDDGKIVNNNSFNIPDDWIGGDVVFVFELKKLRYAKESEDSIQPKEIWYKLNNGDAKNLEIEPTYKSKEGNDTTWSVSVSIEIKTDNLNANEDNVFSLSLSKDGEYKTVKETIHVWTLPDDPSFSSNSDKTFVGKDIIFTINDNVTDGLMSEYIIDGQEVSNNRHTVKATDIGNNEKDDKKYTLTYKYKYGETIWKEGTMDVNVTIYHLPVYSPIVVVNDELNDTYESQDSNIEHTVMPTDKVSFKYKVDYGYEINNHLSNQWSTDSSFVASNKQKSTVTIRNFIDENIYDVQTLTYNINVRLQPSVALHHIEANGISYLFNPSDGIEVSVDKNNDQDDLRWSYAWSVDNVPLENYNQKVIIPKDKLSLEDSEKEKDHKLQVKVICKRGDFSKEYVDETLTHTIKVVSLPKATINNKEDDGNTDIITCDGQQANVEIKSDGGYSGGYKFYIKSKEGGDYGKTSKNEGEDYIIEYQNPSDEEVTSVFYFAGKDTILIEKSTTGKEQIQEVSFENNNSFTATIYPYPQVQFKDQLVNYFYGSKISKELKNNYPSPPTGNEWRFTWKFDDVIQEDFKDKDFFQLEVPDGEDSDSTVHKLRVIGENYYNGKKWGKQDLSLDLTAWHRAQFDGIELKNENGSDNNIYEGRTFQLSSSQKYGYPEGWEYIWEREGISGTLSTNSSDTLTAEFSGNGVSEEQIFKLKVKNSIPGLVESTVFEDDTTQTIIVWKKTDYSPESVGEAIFTITDSVSGSVIDNRIREGQVLRIEVPEAQYGYNNTWNYSWNLSGENSHVIDFTVPSINGNGEAMSKESKEIELSISNIGPDGKSIWDGRNFKKEYTVYRKPRTPLSLVPKGNGTSRTLIATMAISDDQMKDNDYYLYFGHLEADGAVTLIGEPQLQEGPGQTRFSMQIPQELWDDKNNLCVFALWHYGDGTWITSGLRFINDVKEEWDGSDYSGQNKYSGITRSGDTTSIRDVKSLSQEILSTYNVSGAVRGTLQRGLNIVRMTDGTVRKVIIK